MYFFLAYHPVSSYQAQDQSNAERSELQDKAFHCFPTDMINILHSPRISGMGKKRYIASQT